MPTKPKTCQKWVSGGGTYRGNACGKPLVDGEELCKRHLSIKRRVDARSAERRARWDEEDKQRQADNRESKRLSKIHHEEIAIDGDRISMARESFDRIVKRCINATVEHFLPGAHDK